MADNPKLKQARDSYLKAAGQDPDEMSEEQKQRQYEELKKKQEEEQNPEEPSAWDKMMGILKEGIMGTGASAGYTEAIKRRKAMEQKKGRGLKPPKEESEK